MQSVVLWVPQSPSAGCFNLVSPSLCWFWAWMLYVCCCPSFLPVQTPPDPPLHPRSDQTSWMQSQSSSGELDTKAHSEINTAHYGNDTSHRINPAVIFTPQWCNMKSDCTIMTSQTLGCMYELICNTTFALMTFEFQFGTLLLPMC